jgi:alkanesulfonate monooxygenase SsuD/methylene tetrahydromethanopterin reductase-like flavin-dependent oxidoreductase (luciferase family)
MSFSNSTKGLAAALAVALAPVSASAQASPSDAKCFLLSNMFANSTDAKAKQAAAQAVMFYLGRLAGPTARVEAALAAEAKTITPQTAGPTMQTCVQALAQKAKEIQGINERLNRAQAKK